MRFLIKLKFKINMIHTYRKIACALNGPHLKTELKHSSRLVEQSQ